MNIEIVPVPHIDAVWQHVGPKLQKAIDKVSPDMTLGELWQMCRSGNAFLIVVIEDGKILMGCVARFDRWPVGTVLSVLSLGGEQMRKWRDPWREFMTGMAKDNGAIGVYSEGREGWGEVFKNARKLRSAFLLRV